MRRELLSYVLLIYTDILRFVLCTFYTRNRIYYQNNHYHTMPATCTSVFSTPQDASTTTVEALYECAAVSALVANYTAINCADSFDKICEASYTDNPPFSCTSHERPDFLTTLGTPHLAFVTFMLWWTLL